MTITRCSQYHPRPKYIFIQNNKNSLARKRKRRSSAVSISQLATNASISPPRHFYFFSLHPRPFLEFAQNQTFVDRLYARLDHGTWIHHLYHQSHLIATCSPFLAYVGLHVYGTGKEGSLPPLPLSRLRILLIVFLIQDIILDPPSLSWKATKEPRLNRPHRTGQFPAVREDQEGFFGNNNDLLIPIRVQDFLMSS